MAAPTLTQKPSTTMSQNRNVTFFAAHGKTLRWVMFDVLQGNYETNGVALANKALGNILFAQIMHTSASANRYRVDMTNKKLIATVIATGAEVANATDLSGDTLRLLILTDKF